MEKVKVNINVTERELRLIKKIQKESRSKGIDLSIDEIITKLLSDGIRIFKEEMEERYQSVSV